MRGASSLEHPYGLRLRHRTGRPSRLAAREVNELHDVLADELVHLRSPDRASKRVLGLIQFSA